MQVADEQSVLGDFSDTTFKYFETSIRLFRRNGRFFANLVDADAQARDFEITHTFGVSPLQQYLVDTHGGRKQALQVAWDSRPSSEGGQRWYHLYPDEEIGPGDALHWSGRFGNWNFMCAECHSTNVNVGYDIDTDTFDTTYSEVAVGCESCHGPGAKHVLQARSGAFDATFGLTVDLDDRDDAAWIMDQATGMAARSRPADTLMQPDACGRCHSRRSVVAAQYRYGAALTDTHLPALLEENLYHADGRIRGEVYVYGSFIQSRMYRAGVTCTDCHNPHSGQLKAGPNANDTCAQCHLPEKFATAHGGAATSDDCVSCHMPATTYMGIDDRRDHSFRIPNAGAASVHYGAAIAAGRSGRGDDLLLAGISRSDYPPIARATMLTLLGRVTEGLPIAVIREQLGSDDPLIRYAALRVLGDEPPETRLLAGGSALLQDPRLSVRVQAAATYALVREALGPSEAQAFDHAAAEYRQSLLANAPMPEAALSLAGFEAQLGNDSAAEALYAHAVRVGPDFAPAHLAMGLQQVRSGAPDQALAFLERAAKIAPHEPRYAYTWGIALNSLGESDQAVVVLREARRRFPQDFDISWALATIYRDLGDVQAARDLLINLQLRFPERRQIGLLLEALSD
ncbi:MAG: cytochrome c3 family protein [Woeseiaceae bacterium]|nr:cytochrome c3 family protein [Woeseiaceae bacterium]